MQKNSLVNLLESVLEFMRSNRKSGDISDLLMNLDSKVVAPSIEHDLLVEFSHTANPVEEDGVSCMTIDELENMLNEYKNLTS